MRRPCSTVINRGRIFHTSDGTAATFVSIADITDPVSPNSGTTAPSGYLMFRDGTRLPHRRWRRQLDSRPQWQRDYVWCTRRCTNDNRPHSGARSRFNTTGSYYEIAFQGVGGSVTRYIRVYNDVLSNLLVSGTIQTYSGLFTYLPNASYSEYF